jgi:glycine dehydrogenase subunit 1
MMTNSSDSSDYLYGSYLGTSRYERQEMLKEIGKDNILQLFSDVPSELILDEPIDIPGPYSEAELFRVFKKISQKNDVENYRLFLGGGVRQVYIPAFLEEVMRRGEIYTAYTSYQPEVAQGLLQMVFEYESMVAELTGMDVINASLYDWGSAIGEAARMMVRINRKNNIVVAGPISPKRHSVLLGYTDSSSINIEYINSFGDLDFNSLFKRLELEASKDKKDREISGIYFEVPTYHGVLPSRYKEIIDRAHELDILVTVGVDMISLGIIEAPGNYDVDFVVGEGQLLGNAISSGGPLLGIIGSKYNRKWIQNFPGRLVGITKDFRDNDPAYCITLSTREQHIRREKATSNICSNQTLMAINAGIYLASLGPNGLKELAQSLMNRANYLATELNKLNKVKIDIDKPFFAEFVASFENITHDKLEEACLENGIVPGIKIDGEGCLRLIGVSDCLTKGDLNDFIKTIQEVMS